MSAMRPERRAGFAPPARFTHPSDPISSRNYPRPAYGNTYITNNATIINNNYRYDSSHYQPHVAGFYGRQSPLWGNHWRYGCYQSPVWNVSLGVSAGFGFGFYVYTPFYAQCVASPWYYDPYIPAYVPESRVVVWNGYSCGWNDGDTYAYDPYDPYYAYGDYQLNYGLSALSVCYGSRNVNVIADLMGDGDIAIFADGRYEYSLSSDDFSLMLSDNCRACPTVGFDIMSVRYRYGYAVVRCRHRFRWRDGSVHGEYLAFRMRQAGDRYAITDFMTSERQF